MSKANIQPTKNSEERKDMIDSFAVPSVENPGVTVVKFLDENSEKNVKASAFYDLEKQETEKESQPLEAFEYCDCEYEDSASKVVVVGFKKDGEDKSSTFDKEILENSTICREEDASCRKEAESQTEKAVDLVAESTAKVIEDETDSALTEEDFKPAKKAVFKLTKPQNYDELSQKMCCKRGRKLIYRPEEALFEATFTVLGTDKKNDEGIKVKDILEAEIKEGIKLGYIDKFDGLKTSEIKEEYENDTVYEYAEQEFRKMGVIADAESVKVYVYDWDRVGMHHIGYIDSQQFSQALPYFNDKEKYSFDLCGIITGGKSKTVKKGEDGKITIIKDKGESLGVELDVTVILRKD